MYKIYKDRDRVFKCDVDVLGAELSECSARLIFEFEDQTLMVRGKIKNDGSCEVVIPKMKKLNEGEKGKILLEVIAENTLFEAWDSDFEVCMNKKVEVVVEENEDLKTKKSDKLNEDKYINDKKVEVKINEEEELEEETEKKEELEEKEDKLDNVKKTEDKIIENKTDDESSKPKSKPKSKDKKENKKEFKKLENSNKDIDDDNILDFGNFFNK